MPDAMPRVPPGVRPRAGTGSTPKPRTTPAGKQTTRTKIKDGLEGYTQLASVGLAMTNDPWSSLVFDEVGPKWAEAMADLAMVNPQLERVLSKLVEGGTWGAAVGLSVCMVSPIIAGRAPLPDPIKQALAMLPVTLNAVTKETFEQFVREQQDFHAAAQAAAQAAAAANN